MEQVIAPFWRAARVARSMLSSVFWVTTM